MSPWKVAIAAPSGQPYYSNEQTDETRWDMPADFVLPQPPESIQLNCQTHPIATWTLNNNPEICRLLTAKFYLGVALSDAMMKMVAALNNANVAHFEGVCGQLIDIKRQLEALE